MIRFLYSTPIARLCLLALASALSLFCQTPVPPDCRLPFTFPAGTSLPSNVGPFDNRVAGCTTWQIVYNSYTYSALSIVVQTAPNVTPGTPGSWSTFTAVSGSNPNTSTTSGVSTFGGSTSYFPWVRVQLTSGTGAGVISGQLYGWRIPPEASVVIPAGTLCPIGTPCYVDQVGNATVLSNQQSVTTSAVALATNGSKNICVKALSTNTASVYIGPSGITTSTGMELAPGDAYCGTVSNTNLIFVRAAAGGSSVSWIATN